MAKVHDKFVIELAEVIKGYGNDPDVDDPFHLSKFYRFYELPEIAVSANHFKTMIPLATEFRVTPRTIRKHRRQIADRRMKDARLPEEIRRIYSGVGAGVKKSLFHELTEQERFCREWDTTVELLKKTYGDALNKIMLRAHNRSSGMVL